MLKERGFTPLETTTHVLYPKPKHKRFLSLTGFTLLEVLLATLIITVGVTTLIWAFSSGLSATTEVENMDLALNIAQAKMEVIKNTAFANVASSSATADANFSRFFYRC